MSHPAGHRAYDGNRCRKNGLVPIHLPATMGGTFRLSRSRGPATVSTSPSSAMRNRHQS